MVTGPPRSRNYSKIHKPQKDTDPFDVLDFSPTTYY